MVVMVVVMGPSMLLVCLSFRRGCGFALLKLRNPYERRRYGVRGVVMVVVMMAKNTISLDTHLLRRRNVLVMMVALWSLCSASTGRQPS